MQVVRQSFNKSRNGLIYVAVYLHLYRIFIALCGSWKLNCDVSVKGSQRACDTCNDLAIVLQRFWNMFKTFVNSLQLLRDACEDFAIPCERLATV